MSELLLVGGTVLDGSGRDGVRMDVAVRDGVQVESVSGAAKRLDCEGLFVTPGFIDTHSHSDVEILCDPLLPCKSRQGVCCDVLGQDGLSVAPLLERDVEAVRRQLAGLDGVGEELDWGWRSVDDYLQRIEGANASIDAAYLVPHGQLRRGAMGMEGRPATREELDAMCALLDRGMREGGLGLSSGLIYPPCCFADSEELNALCGVVAKHDGVFVVHMRSESDYVLDALREVISAARVSGCRLCISHIKLAGEENWGKVDAMIELIAEGREAGVEITADQYPYTAGSTMMGAILPPWAHAGGGVLERLSSMEQRGRMAAEMRTVGRQRWDNFWGWSGPEGIVISDISNPDSPNRRLMGKSLLEASRAANADDPLEFALDLLRREEMGVSMIAFSQSEDVVKRLYGQPWVGVCTDGLVGGHPHPRTYNAFARALSWMVREERVVDWPEAVRKMTSLPAESFRLRGLGRIAPGMAGSLVAFDPREVAPGGGYDNPRAHPGGVRHVVVNGVVVVENGETTGSRGGGVLRGPGWDGLGASPPAA